MSNLDQAILDYRRAKFSSDWAHAIWFYADRELCLSVKDPITFNLLEEKLDAFFRAEQAAYEEVQYYEQQANDARAQSGGRHAGRM